MKKPFLLLLHFGYWLLYLLPLAILFAAVTRQIKHTSNFYSVLPLFFLYLTPNLVSFYSSYFFLFPKFLLKKKLFALIIFGIIFCLISAVTGSLISTVFFGFDQPVFNDRNEFIGFTGSLTLLAAVHAVIALIIRGFVTWYDEIKLKEELVQKNYLTEIALIKSQINPHFLFNTINNIDVLIGKDPEKASAFLNKLSDILRYMVYETRSGKIPLVEELKYIEKYLELQKIRTTNPNYIYFEIKGEAKSLQIAPMIFFPFIENAFKHTENDKKSNTIKILFSVNETTVNFECNNTYQKNVSNKQEFGGLGNEMIQKRLNLLYPDKYTLEINCNDCFYMIKLGLNLK